MRIEELVLERYGIFTNRKLSFHPDAALHVVLGANEAGKTSALSAIGDLLFGFGTRTDYGFRHDSKLLRIGGIVRHSDGRAIAARRRKGNKNTLLDADDQPLPDDSFAAMLGGISRVAFNREFGMTAQALRDGGGELLSAGGRLAETLAASSAGMTELSRVKDRLQAQADELFTARRAGSKPFYLAAERREDADKSLRNAIVTREALQQLQTAVQDAVAKLDSLKVAHAASGGTLSRWQRTLRVRSQLARLESIDAQLAALAALPVVAEQTLTEWRRALDTQAALDAEIAVVDAAAATEAAEMETMNVDDALLSEGAAIEALRERLGAVRKAATDLPRRRHDRDSAEAMLDDSARRLGLASHTELLARLPTDPALADARDLIEQMRRATQALADNESRCDRALKELDELAADDRDARFVSDIEPLRQRFEALGDIAAQEERMRLDSAARAIELEALTDTAAALIPAPGSLDRLRALPLPDRATMAKYANAIELGETDIKRLDLAIAALDGTIATSEMELARLSISGVAPTKVDLLHARQARDARIDDLRAGLDDNGAVRIARIDDVADASREIDGITDLLLTDTERATRQEDAQRRIADARDTREREIEKRASLQRGLANIGEAWLQAWAASGLQPLSAPEMLRWRERLDDVIARLDKSDLQRAGLDALASGLEAGKTAVVSFLESVGRQPDRASPAGVLYREAKERVNQLVAAWSEAKAHAANKSRLARDLAEADVAREQLQARIANLKSLWSHAMSTIGLDADSSPTHAEAALAVWNAVGLPRASFMREGRSVDTIVSDLHEFDTDVAALLDRVAPVLRQLSAQDAMSRIAGLLEDARRGFEVRKRLQESAEKRASSRSVLMAKLATVAVVLEAARHALGIDDTGGLAEPIAGLSVRLALESEQVTLRHHLLEMADGYDEDALRNERQGIDLDRLPADIASETVQQERLLKDISDASAAHHQLQRELEMLTKGRDASAAMTRRTEAGADMLSIAEDWLLRSAASSLARRAIELHRNKVQDPMIARASVLFALATADGFAGLGIDYDDEDQPTLVARRREGSERVPVAGLSEGTRDQLFLALRLALLERRASEPMPFIGDDLLASFDERRSLATLRLLAAAGRDRQIIVFTHHRHVAELALSLAEHRVDLIDL